MRAKVTIIALATGLVLMALPAAAFANEEGTGATSPPELVPPPGCDYSAGDCPIVFDPAADKCVVSRARVWVGRDGGFTIIDWTWGDNPELDEAVKAADDQFTKWIADGDLKSLRAACGDAPAESATPAEPEVPADPSADTPASETADSGGPDGGTPPTSTPEPPRKQSDLPAIPAECVQEDGSYRCPDGLPPYGCWAVPAPNDPELKVGLCICPPEVPINLCDWEPTSCEGGIDPPALPSCTFGDEGNPVCETLIPLTRRDATGTPKPRSKSKPKARARTRSGDTAKLHGAKKRKATKKHSAQRSHRSAKKKKSSRR